MKSEQKIEAELLLQNLKEFLKAAASQKGNSQVQHEKKADNLPSLDQG